MLKTLGIHRYRGIDALELDGLGPLNVLVGANGAGKTTVLEALVLLVSGGQPDVVPRLAAVRGLDVALDAPKAARDLYWAPMFFNLEVNSPAVFTGVQTAGPKLEVSMQIEKANFREVPITQGQPDAFLLSAEEEQLVFRFASNGIENERRMILGEGAIRIDGVNVRPRIPSAYISPHSGDSADEAKDLAKLQQTKQLDVVIDALQRVEPRIQGIEVSVSGGRPVIFCDLGLSELIPLSSLGGGILRITRLLLTISSAPGGIALIDEVETGLHHSAMSTAWTAIRSAADQFRTQVVTTTHSRECIWAAHAALGEDGFRLIRVERPNGKTKAIPYTPEALAGAVGFNMEVR